MHRSPEDLPVIMRYCKQWNEVKTEFDDEDAHELTDDQKPKLSTSVVEAIGIIKLTCTAIMGMYDTTTPATPETFAAYHDVFKAPKKAWTGKFMMRLAHGIRLSSTFVQAEVQFVRCADVEMELTGKMAEIEAMNF